MYGARGGAHELILSKIKFFNKMTLRRHHAHHTFCKSFLYIKYMIVVHKVWRI